MPDHSVAGSAGLRNGSNIELMQNRRLLGYDAYGIPEPLNDQDQFGKGLSVNTKYFMQIFDMKK
jgi:hypothetical protein